MTTRDPLPPINFAALADALLARARTLLPAWLPGGAFKSNEYTVLSIWRTEKSPSLSVCVQGEHAGRWGDFGGEQRGNDLVSLYAAIHGLDNGKAAVQVAREEGLEDVASVRPGNGAAPSPRPLPPPAPAAAARKPEPEGWRTVRPVPADGPAATFRHQHRHAEDIEHTATYRTGDDLHGYVVRFRTSDGGKETLPYTWCTSARDGGSRWHWKQWDEPRPLYLPGHALPGERTVVLVEGEKKADILQALLDATAPGIYTVASWPGGCKAWKKAAWDWLQRCTVVLWPDCDGKRVPLTKAEQAQYADDLARAVAQAAQPLLPAAKQPGMSAMLGIGAHLRDSHDCTVQLLPIPEPGAVEDGWDCADAIDTDGWDGARVLSFFAQAHALPADVGADASAGSTAPGRGSGGNTPPRDGPADAGDDGDAFQDHLNFVCETLKCKVHDLGINRKLLIAALRKAPGLKDCLGFNELTGAPSTRVAWPWRNAAGPLLDSDDLRLGDYLCTKYKLKAASRAALAEAIDTVADERRFHPIRDWLGSLRHDGKKRSDKWLIHVLGMDPAKLPPKRKRYLELVGRYLLMGLVARVMEPGCKFDYSPVFEGLPGVGKSTFVKELVGREFFSDTHFDIGNGKEGFEQLEGLWGYELSELTALRKADSEQVKQFFSSTIDRFRGAYGRFVQPHPRQCVIFCSTNKKQYLYDLTGNRRFWPVWIDQRIKLDWLRKYRDQLFAEAYALYQGGASYTPSPEEEEAYFVPEQKLRLVETAVQSRLYELLTREGALNNEGRLTSELNQLTTFVTLDRLVSALGADAAKSSSLLESQIRSWLDGHGWVQCRESVKPRRRGYQQPAAWPPKIDDDEGALAPWDKGSDRQTQAETIGGDDDEPF